MTEDEQASLIEQYKATTTEKEKAAIEDRLWDGLSREERNKTRKRNWMTERVGPAGRDAEFRSRVYHLGPAVDALWNLVDSGAITLRVAVELARNAKKLSKSKQLPLQFTVLTVLSKSRKVPAHVRHEMAETVKVNTAVPTGEPQAGAPFAPFAPPPLENGAPKSSTITHTKTLLRQLRATISQYVALKVEDPTDTGVLSALQILEAEIESAFNAFTEKLSRIRSAKREDAQFMDQISRRDLIRACQLLGVDSPKPGGPVDMKRAKKTFKVLVHQYHPDTQGGSHAMQEQYEDVLAAYQLLKNYEATRSGTATASA
jgi:hypothetical protein